MRLPAPASLRPSVKPNLRPTLLVFAASLLLTFAAGWVVCLRPELTAAAAVDHAVIVDVARLSDHPSITAQGRTPTHINLSDGRDLLTAYQGTAQLSSALHDNTARPLSLSSADFDEDGTPDLVSGYSLDSLGLVVIHRGNVDSVYPNSPQALQRKLHGTHSYSPFLSPALVFEVPVPADFLGCGDFDGDSHRDVVVATRGGDNLYLLSGDGAGALSKAKVVELPGRVTALTVGEVNRGDGLEDIAVGVNSPDHAMVLVYEGPEGALLGAPEQFPVPAEVTSLVLAELDGHYAYDIAVAAGNHLLVVGGRDRRLSHDEDAQAGVEQARVDRRELEFRVISLAAGEFSGSGRTDLALLAEGGAVEVLENPGIRSADKRPVPVAQWLGEVIAEGRDGGSGRLVTARVSSVGADGLLIAETGSSQLQIISPTAAKRHRNQEAKHQAELVNTLSTTLELKGSMAAVLPMRLSESAMDGLVITRANSSAPAVVRPQAATTFIVSSAADSGPGTLRQSILDANANSGNDTIRFGFRLADLAPIDLVTALPAITEAVTIDGTTQPLFTGTPIIELNGAAVDNGIGLDVATNNTVIRGLVIRGFSSGIARAIRIVGTRNRIEGNFIGTNRAGTAAIANSLGILVEGGRQNVIGGTAAAARNLISGNTNGLLIAGTTATSNKVEGNFIGTDVNGTAALGNSDDGVEIGIASSNTIGGTAAGARNIISGNGDVGLVILVGASGNTVQGNFIGTDVNGTADLGNNDEGITILTGLNNTVGGTSAAARNIISGNGDNGIQIFNDEANDEATGNKVEGNFIGTDLNGTADLGNTSAGVLIEIARNNSIGGTASGARNVISGNNSDGVRISGTLATGNTVQGNFIGTNLNGSGDLGNSSNGVAILGAPNNTIGGTASGARNIISGNFQGVLIQDSTATGNKVEGNFIGTDVNGTAELSNSFHGVAIAAPNNTIGGTAPGARNVISGNNRLGIIIADSTATGNRVEGNFIGTDVNGTANLGNSLGGVLIAAPNNIIGGTASGARNIISGNDRVGVLIADSIATSNRVEGNFIGTDVNGVADLGNSDQGVLILDAPNNTIGGTASGARNIISGNDSDGVEISGATAIGNRVQGNFIGTAVNGVSPRGNSNNGVLIEDAKDNTIGGTSAAARNVIFDNGSNGVEILGASASGNKIEGNFIGTGGSGTAGLGNDNNGVLIFNAVNNTIGGTDDGAGNLICCNSSDGVEILGNTATGNRILNNSISFNGRLGIDLNADLDLVTANDPSDADTGPNNLQNFPVLTTVTVTGVQGELISTPSTAFTIQIFSNSSCDPFGNGEGQTLITSVQIATGANGMAFFSANIALLSGAIITATATDLLGNTSEFSECQRVPGPRILQFVKEGKKLIITGEGFASGAKVLLNGVEQKTKFESSTRVIGKKVGKKARGGDLIQVRNPDGTVTQGVVFQVP